jgi:hypothetical protein
MGTVAQRIAHLVPGEEGQKCKYRVWLDRLNSEWGVQGVDQGKHSEKSSKKVGVCSEILEIDRSGDKYYQKLITSQTKSFLSSMRLDFYSVSQCKMLQLRGGVISS